MVKKLIDINLIKYKYIYIFKVIYYYQHMVYNDLIFNFGYDQQTVNKLNFN